jgi:hypothetical protein
MAVTKRCAGSAAPTSADHEASCKAAQGAHATAHSSPRVAAGFATCPSAALRISSGTTSAITPASLAAAGLTIAASTAAAVASTSLAAATVSIATVSIATVPVASLAAATLRCVTTSTPACRLYPSFVL